MSVTYIQRERENKTLLDLISSGFLLTYSYILTHSYYFVFYHKACGLLVRFWLASGMSPSPATWHLPDSTFFSYLSLEFPPLFCTAIGPKQLLY